MAVTIKWCLVLLGEFWRPVVGQARVLRAAEVSHLLLAHLIALPAQAQIAAVVTEESRPGDPGFNFSKRGYSVFEFIRLNSNDKGQSSNFK